MKYYYLDLPLILIKNGILDCEKLIAIFCFAALLLSTSSLSYFYWLQEKLHEQERFASIDVGEILEKKMKVIIIVAIKSPSQ